MNRQDIAAVADLIRPHVRRTPTIDVAGRDLGVALDRVTLKLEIGRAHV